jgi:MFS family permease
MGETVSVLGTQFHFVALPWLVLQLTGSGLALGTVLMTAAVPRALFMLFGGALSDRFSPRSAMLASNLSRGALGALLALLLAADLLQFWQLYVISFLFGLADAFFYPAFTSVVPLVAERERLASANALLQGSAQLLGLVGPAASGIVIAVAGLALVFGIDALTFFFAALMLVLMKAGRRETRARQAGSPAITDEILKGVRYAWQQPLLRGFLFVTAGLNFAFVGPFVVGSAVLADRKFGGATSLGIMLSALAAGSLLGTLAAGTVRTLGRRGLVVLGVLATLLAGLALLPFAAGAWTAAAIIFPVGVGAGLTNITVITWIQRHTEPGMLGRVMGLIMFNAVGLTPLSYALAGLVVEIGVGVMFAGAAACVALVLLYSLLNPALRTWD